MRYLIVDGHSVIFSWPELRTLHVRRMVLARDELIKTLTQHQDASGVRVIAVFDGQGAKFSQETTEGGIQIFYSAATQTADQIIERLVAKYGHEHEITVATSDLLERQTTAAFGAYTVSTDGLRELIAEAQSHLVRELKSHRKKDPGEIKPPVRRGRPQSRPQTSQIADQLQKKLPRNHP
ncbi:MAG: RNA-binding protein [Chthoniobacteraceae bacterium]|nr:RNA-binding protein [Chthoniobacteraceae bacterium]